MAPCTCTDLKPRTLQYLSPKTANQADMGTEPDCEAIPNKFLSGEPDFKHLCSRHIRTINSYIGLWVNRPTTEGVQAQILTYWQSRADLTSSRGAPDTYQWFRLADRPTVAGDELGIFQHKPAIGMLLQQLPDTRRPIIFDELAGPGSWNR